MRILVFLMIMSIPLVSAQAQNSVKKSRKELRAEKEQKRKAEIVTLIDSVNFVFEATHALPMSGGTIFLNHDYDLKLTTDSVFSYLPFYGVAYYAEYGGRNGGFIFDKPIYNFKKEKKKENYLLKFEVDRGNDNLSFILNVSELGFADLTITSTNRQSISFYGIIEKIE